MLRYARAGIYRILRYAPHMHTCTHAHTWPQRASQAYAVVVVVMECMANGKRRAATSRNYLHCDARIWLDCCTSVRMRALSQTDTHKLWCSRVLVVGAQQHHAAHRTQSGLDCVEQKIRICVCIKRRDKWSLKSGQKICTQSHFWRIRDPYNNRHKDYLFLWLLFTSMGGKCCACGIKKYTQRLLPFRQPIWARVENYANYKNMR